MRSEGVSVIMPAHNGANFLAPALDSIVQQNWPDLEIIVVDDGSTDDLPAAIRSSGVPVRYLQQENRGPAAARNLGVRAAGADFIAFLDIDDLWTAGHLARLSQALSGALASEPETGFAQGLVRQFVVLPDGRRLLSGAYRMPYLGACLFLRRVLRERGGFDENMQMGEDYDFMFRCWEADIRKQNVEEVSLLYRRHPGNMTRGKNRAANLAVVHRRIERIRSGVVDPAAPRRFPFAKYIGDVRGFAETRLEMPGQWTLSSAS